MILMLGISKPKPSTSGCMPPRRGAYVCMYVSLSDGHPWVHMGLGFERKRGIRDGWARGDSLIDA
jgi:hypothetical protein